MTDGQRPNGKAPTESLAEATDRLAAALDDVGRHVVGKAVEYARAGVTFATLDAGRLSFRLRPEIVAAALRTPDTTPSSRGHEWIALALVATVPDSFALDRAEAWFESAWRFAGESTQPGAAPN
jgi:hypothetical protein